MIDLVKRPGMPKSFEPKKDCEHPAITLIEMTTVGRLLPGPDTRNTYTYKCDECGCILSGRWRNGG